MTLTELTYLVARQDGPAVQPDTCDSGNEFDGRIGLRIASIFVILVGSCCGATFPILAKTYQRLGVPDWAFFIAKFFGSGVIIATAFIHLLSPAVDALTNPCLTGPITEYSWPEGIVLMVIFVMFFIELMVMRYGNFGGEHDHSGHVHDHSSTTVKSETNSVTSPQKPETAGGQEERRLSFSGPGEDHFGHERHHNDIEQAADPFTFEDYSAQLTAIFILEFGVIFHSVFIGLTLAVSGPEFITLFIVLVFHQTFEGLGLGSRLAVTPWPKNRWWTPYALALGYGISTPIAIAIGLGVRNSYPPTGRTTLLVNGVFDSISAGILIYTGLVELMAHEFMFSESMRTAPIKVVLSAILLMCLGAGLMALLGKWA